MKEAYYFPHDANARTDAKILELRAELGWEGYGLWWALVEQLREAGDYKLSNTLIGGLAMGLAIPKDKLRALLDLCIAVGLLVVEGDCFYSPSLRRRMVALDNKRLARVESARNAAEKRWQKPSDANAMPPHAERMPDAMPIDATIDLTREDLTKPNLTKEENTSLRSEDAATAADSEPQKKIEGEDFQPDSPAPKKPPVAATPRFVPPTYDDMLGYMVSQRPNNPPAELERTAAKCFGYYSGNGWKVGKNPMKDWKGACQTFLADVPKLQASASPAVILPVQQPQYGGYQRQQPISQVTTRTAAIAGADAMFDAVAAGRDPFHD